MVEAGEIAKLDTAVLEDGLKWVPTQLTSVDREFLASRQFLVREIACTFDVPLPAGSWWAKWWLSFLKLAKLH